MPRDGTVKPACRQTGRSFSADARPAPIVRVAIMLMFSSAEQARHGDWSVTVDRSSIFPRDQRGVADLCRRVIMPAKSRGRAFLAVGSVLATSAAAIADSWPMKHRDVQHTGRSSFVVPANRQNDTFFNIPAWQTPTPGSPGEGNVDSGSLVFFDGAGGADLLVGGYHWPKGVMGV